MALRRAMVSQEPTGPPACHHTPAAVTTASAMSSTATPSRRCAGSSSLVRPSVLASLPRPLLSGPGLRGVGAGRFRADDLADLVEPPDDLRDLLVLVMPERDLVPPPARPRVERCELVALLLAIPHTVVGSPIQSQPPQRPQARSIPQGVRYPSVSRGGAVASQASVIASRSAFRATALSWTSTAA